MSRSPIARYQNSRHQTYWRISVGTIKIISIPLRFSNKLCSYDVISRAKYIHANSILPASRLDKDRVYMYM